MDDDDLPPPLSSLHDQVNALSPSTAIRFEGDDDDNLPLATTTIPTIQNSGSKVADPVMMKRGFFDAKPKPKLRPRFDPAAENSTAPGPAVAGKKDDGITLLTGKKDKLGGGGPSIPDFLRVEPDEQAKRMQQVKGKLVDALKPTPDMLSKLGTNPGLLSAFEDAEVMTAVDEIAKDPSKMIKYKENKKVQEFYRAMALFAGSQLEQMDNKPL